MTPYVIAGSSAGLQTNKKPFMIPDQAFSTLENAYVWRDRVKKRECLRLLARLRRRFTASSLGNYSTILGTNTISIFTILGVNVSEPNAQIEVNTSLPTTFTFGAPISQTLTDTLGTGVLTIDVAGPISSAKINYNTGVISITGTGVVGPAAVTWTGAYFPGLPSMGIDQEEVFSINNEPTIFFDTKYAYIYSGTGFQEFIPGTTWNGTNADFFWYTNYRGSTADVRLMFVTNFVCSSTNPIRYTDGITWTDFAPLVDATHNLYQARILLPYYGRLIALNVFEGTTAGGYASALNIYNRCRFSQIGSPIAVDAWRSDQFGKGGFLDAPVDEAILSARFYKNTLIVGFERSTWQLRYVGEYGLPFVWERISSDFGCESTFSTVLFDEGILQVGDRAIVSSNSNSVDRIDEQIPDTVFNIRNSNEGKARVHGIRDFQRELVFWCYPDSQTEGVLPNKVLVYNYKNNTYAIFRDNIFTFGYFQPPVGVLWGSLDIFWADEDVFWKDPDSQSEFPFIVSGNQQGYIHYYGYNTPEDPSLSITAVDMSVSPNVLTIPNHNLETFEVIKVSDLLFLSAPSIVLNNRYFRIRRIDANNVALTYYDVNADQYYDTPAGTNPTYIGNGKITLYPVMNIMTKDFNPYMQQGNQFKISYIDFLTDNNPEGVVAINLFINSSLSVVGNLETGNYQNEQSLPSPYYVPASDYAWHRYFATSSGQFLRIQITYDNALMNLDSTHRSNYVLNAITLWFRQGGKTIF